MKIIFCLFSFKTCFSDLQCNGSADKERETAFQNMTQELREGFPCQNAFTCHKISKPQLAARRGVTRWARGSQFAGCRKVPTMSQVLSSIQHIYFRKTSCSNTRAAKLASCPGRHLTSLRPWQHGSQSSPNPRTHGKAATIASYRVFHVLGKHNEPFEGSDILKKAFLEATNSLLENFNNKTDRESQKEVQLSRNASTKQCEGIATYVEEQLRKDFETWECFPLQFGVMTDRWMWNNCVFSSGWVLKTWVPRKSYSPLSIKRTHQMWDWEFFNAFCGTC